MLKTKIHRLEVNVEVNGLYGNDTTLPWFQKKVCVPGNKSTSGHPPWNSLGAKPKSKSFPWEMGGRVTGRAQCPEICDATGWPALSSRHSASSTPVLSRKQPWSAAKGRTNNKPP